MSVNFIHSNSELCELCNDLANSSAIAIDTEFMRVATYYPKLALIQVADYADSWIIDPLTIDNWSPFTDILLNPSIVKVLHSCAEDLEVLLYHLSCLPKPIFDTQIAATFFSIGQQMGYSRLVEQQFGECLSKSVTLSNWLQRPLSQEQLTYAIDDVAWLLPLYQQFLQLGEDNPSLWQQCVDNSEQQLVKAQQPRIHDAMHKKVAHRKKLTKSQEYCLQQMFIWREMLAQQSDTPRPWIIKDKHLLKLCKLPPSQPLTLQALYQIEDYSKVAIKHFGQKVIDQMNNIQRSNPISDADGYWL